MAPSSSAVGLRPRGTRGATHVDEHRLQITLGFSNGERL